MAIVAGLQTSEEEDEKTVILKGTAELQPADDTLRITIPTEHQAPTNRTIDIRWSIRIVEQDFTP